MCERSTKTRSRLQMYLHFLLHKSILCRHVLYKRVEMTDTLRSSFDWSLFCACYHINNPGTINDMTSGIDSSNLFQSHSEHKSVICTSVYRRTAIHIWRHCTPNNPYHKNISTVEKMKQLTVGMRYIF